MHQLAPPVIARNRTANGAGRREPVDGALRQVELITALGALVSSVELLSDPAQLGDHELQSWAVARTRHRWMDGPGRTWLSWVYSAPGVRALLVIRALGAAALLAPRVGDRARSAAVGSLMVTSYALHLRSPYGSDGSEHMSTITLTCLSASRVARSDPRARAALVAFVAAQSCLSYAAAGAAKLVSPVWRDGSALRNIFRTRMYGHPWVYALLRDRPLAARAIGLVTIGGELAFPLVLVAPRSAARTLLGVGLGFHVGNALFMGLNRFVWAFVGTYPAIRFCARHLGRRR